MGVNQSYTSQALKTLTIDSGLKSRFLFLFNISVLLDVFANLPETSPFFVSPNSFGEHLFSNIHSNLDV